MATKKFAHGAKLSIGDGGTPTEVFTKIGNVQDITLPSSAADLVDVTDHDSPNGRREYIGGLIDSDEMTVTINWDPEDAVHSDVESRVGENANFKLELANKLTPTGTGTVYAFNALIRKFVGKAPVNGVHTADITLKPSGSLTKTTAS